MVWNVRDVYKSKVRCIKLDHHNLNVYEMGALRSSKVNANATLIRPFTGKITFESPLLNPNGPTLLSYITSKINI